MNWTVLRHVCERRVGFALPRLLATNQKTYTCDTDKSGGEFQAENRLSTHERDLLNDC
ncbi:hypothetical protein R2A130_1810 [Ahrensia sp. R2A130]|nr:hypothetical protein R2A130_1810 [Ahrensia sp. R2A130]